MAVSGAGRSHRRRLAAILTVLIFIFPLLASPQPALGQHADPASPTGAPSVLTPPGGFPIQLPAAEFEKQRSLEQFLASGSALKSRSPADELNIASAELELAILAFRHIEASVVNAADRQKVMVYAFYQHAAANQKYRRVRHAPESLFVDPAVMQSLEERLEGLDKDLRGFDILSILAGLDSAYRSRFDRQDQRISSLESEMKKQALELARLNAIVAEHTKDLEDMKSQRGQQCPPLCEPPIIQAYCPRVCSLRLCGLRRR